MPKKHQHRRHETTPGFRPVSMPEQAHWMRELGKSSAASKHTPKPRKGSRQERRRQAIRDQNES